MNRKFKKGLALVLVLVMVFATTASVFADTNGTVNVKFYVPEKYASLEGNYTTLNFDGYTLYGQKADPVTSENVGVYEYAGTVNLSTMNHPAVQLPEGFAGLYNNNGNAFDAIYNVAVTQKQESSALYGTNAANNASFVYGFDMPSYTLSGARADGIFISKLSGNSTSELDASYGAEGESYWLGYSWSFYVVPESEHNFDPLNPNEIYKSDLYPNNVNAADGYTYYMIYEYNEQYW